MAFKISDYTGGVIAPDSTYPDGQVKNDPFGTRVDRTMMGDIVQLMQRVMRNAGITPNDTEDNAVNGFQLMQALNTLINQESGGMAEAYGAGSLTGVPVIASGCVVTGSGPSRNITEGWFWSNGQFVYNQPKVGVVITDIPTIIINIVDGLPTGTLINHTAIADATHFPTSAVVTWSEAVGLDQLQTAVAALQVLTTVSAWTNITPATGWATSGGLPAGYNKNGMGYVELRGIITNTSTAAPALALFTLPVGFRPATTRRFSQTIWDANTNSFIIGYLEIATTGAALLILDPGVTPTVTNWYLYLDSINFYTS